jgi:hypothetical protein
MEEWVRNLVKRIQNAMIIWKESTQLFHCWKLVSVVYVGKWDKVQIGWILGLEATNFTYYLHI